MFGLNYNSGIHSWVCFLYAVNNVQMDKQINKRRKISSNNRLILCYTRSTVLFVIHIFIIPNAYVFRLFPIFMLARECYLQILRLKYSTFNVASDVYGCESWSFKLGWNPDRGYLEKLF